MANDFRRGIRVYLETSDYSKGISELVNQNKKLNAEYEQLNNKAATLSSSEQKRLKQLKSQIEKNAQTEASYKQKLKETEAVLNNLSGTSYNELIKVNNRLQKELKETERGTELYNQRLKQSKIVAKEVVAAQAEMRLAVGVGNTVFARGIAMFGNYRIAIMGYFAVIMAGFYALGAAFRKVAEFSKSISELSALTGAQGKDLKYLKEKAKELGAQYGKSAKEIVDAMKLVGSAKPELLDNMQALSNTTSAVIMLSKATGMDLAEATNSVTTIMNQFNKTGTDAENVVNILAAGSKYGAKEVDYLGDSISKVGTVAKAAGLSLETTTAVMELFGEKGIRAEVAGTGFKSILVELQSDTKNYTNGLFDLNKAIDNNHKISGDNIALQAKFGKEFFGLAQILLQNKERFIELTEQVTNTTVAEEQMAVATDNLTGDVNKLSSGWDRFMLSLEDGEGPIARATRGIIQLFTTALNGINALTKSGKQKAGELAEQNLNVRMKGLTQGLPSTGKDGDKSGQLDYISSVITSEQKIYKARQSQINDIQQTIKANENLGGAWLKNNKELVKKMNSLQNSVNNSIAFVNAAAGLRAEIKTQNKPISEDETTENTSSLSGGGSKMSKSKQSNKWDAEIKQAEENAKLQEIIYLTMLKNRIIDEEQYNIISERLTLDLLNKKKAIFEQYGQDTKEIQKQILESEIKQGDLAGKIKPSGTSGLSIDPLKIDQDALNAGLQAYVKNIQDKKKAEYEFAEWKKETIAKGLDDTVALTEAAVNAVNAYHQMEADSLEAEKQRELTAAGDNADAREDIEKKYAQKELELKKKQANADMAIKIAQAVAGAAQAIVSIWAVHAENPILAAALTTIAGATTLFQIASIKKQRDAIMATTLDSTGSSGSASTGARVANSQRTTSQAAEGRWDVIGADDGRTYRNVPYRGVARTGIYRSPVLVAERGDELIVDNPTLRNIRMDAPHLLNEINRYRVRQYADGKWDAASQSAGSQSDLTAILMANTSIMDKIYALLEWYQTNRIEAYTVLSEFEAKRDLRDKSIKKGSLS